jgi:cytoskeletal protein CcmA (bactofilin family)
MLNKENDEQEGTDEHATNPAEAENPANTAQSAAQIRPAVIPPGFSRHPQTVHDISGHDISGHDISGRRKMQESDDEKKLIVGRNIVLNGEIKSCDKLVVEGHVEANISDCRTIIITEGGSFKGMAEIDTAEISGVFDGSITAHELLVVRASGRISGKVRFCQLEIERGGEITGDIQAFGPNEACEAAPEIVDDVPAE